MPEFDAIGFAGCQQFHRLTVDELDLGQLERHHMAVVDGGANELEIGGGNPTADA